MLLEQLRKTLKVVRGISDGKGLMSLDEWKEKDKDRTIVLPRKFRGGESAWVFWMGSSEMGVMVVDDAWGRPSQTFLFKGLPGEDPNVDSCSVFPVKIIDSTYQLDPNFQYPHVTYSHIPMTVVSQTNETWECTARGARRARTGLEVVRALYDPKETEETLAQYLLVSKSVFEKAPPDFVSPYGPTSQEIWLEMTREFNFDNQKVFYQRVSRREIALTRVVGDQSLTMLDRFTEPLEAEMKLLPAKRPQS